MISSPLLFVNCVRLFVWNKYELMLVGLANEASLSTCAALRHCVVTLNSDQKRTRMQRLGQRLALIFLCLHAVHRDVRTARRCVL